MESFFVLTKFYKLPKSEVISDLKTILSLEGVINKNKIILFEALNIIENKNIDFVDALICAKCKLQNYDKLSFDKDLERC
jgi:predicted nucleic-acid-binding protein